MSEPSNSTDLFWSLYGVLTFAGFVFLCLVDIDWALIWATLCLMFFMGTVILGVLIDWWDERARRRRLR